MTGRRKRYTAEFKAKVALEAPRGELTAAQLAARHGIHQTMAGEWKRQAMEGLTSVFSGKAEAAEAAQPAEVEKLHAKIGQPVVERGFFSLDTSRGETRAPCTLRWLSRRLCCRASPTPLLMVGEVVRIARLGVIVGRARQGRPPRSSADQAR